MSVADKDGKIAQAVGDRLACLGIEINESIREAAAALQDGLPNEGEQPR